MMKRFIDISGSLLGLVGASPFLLVVIFLVWKEDGKSPFYIAPRTGRGGKTFRMIKLRSMVIGADTSGVDSTSGSDMRITSIGHKIRSYKLDEIMQLWNVLIGDMSLVGPRPNVKNETDIYTEVEKYLLFVSPGITDFSSIVFSDEGDILKGKEDADLSYNQLIRPWKSRLGLIYIENQSTWLDLRLIFYTAVAIISKPVALTWLVSQLKKMNVDPDVINISKRDQELYPFPPPGMDKVVVSR